MIEDLSHALPALGGLDTEHLLAWLATLMSVFAVLGWALDAALPRLHAHAESTKTKTDDQVVSWLEKLSAVLGLVNSLVPRPTFGKRPPKRSAPTDVGPLSVFFAVVMAGSLFLQACDTGAWDAHSIAAQTAHETARTGRTIILGERRAALVRAGTGAEDIAAAVHAAAAVWDSDNGALVEGYNLFAASANEYARLAFAALRGEMDDLDHLRVAAGHVADAWNAVAGILDAVGAAEDLPRIPDWLLAFLRGDITAQPTAGGAL